MFPQLVFLSIFCFKQELRWFLRREKSPSSPNQLIQLWAPFSGMAQIIQMRNPSWDIPVVPQELGDELRELQTCSAGFKTKAEFGAPLSQFGGWGALIVSLPVWGRLRGFGEFCCFPKATALLRWGRTNVLPGATDSSAEVPEMRRKFLLCSKLKKKNPSVAQNKILF